MSKPTLVKSWKELSKVADSDTHRLDIDVDRCNGWINRKDADDGELGYYLSTHTFYGPSEYRRSTEILQSAGFNIEIDNWDKAEIEAKSQ